MKHGTPVPQAPSDKELVKQPPSRLAEEHLESPAPHSKPESATSLDKDTYFIRISPYITTRDNRPLVNIEGETNLPDKAVLQVRFYYETFGKKRLIDMQRGWVNDKSYLIEIGPFRGKMPAGNYPITVTFNPARQLKMVKEEVKNKTGKIQNSTILKLGTAQEAVKQREEMLEVIKNQAGRFEGLYQELLQHFKQNINAEEFDPKQWKDWLNNFNEKLDEIIRLTQAQDTLRVFDKVLEAKVHIENLCRRLKGLGRICSHALSEASRESAVLYEQILKEMDSFKLQLEENLDFLGVRKKINQGVFNEALSRLGKMLAAFPADLNTWRKKAHSSAEVLQECREQQVAISQSVLVLSQELPPTEHFKITELTHNSLRILEILSQTAEGKITPILIKEYDILRDKIKEQLTKICTKYLKDSD